MPTASVTSRPRPPWSPSGTCATQGSSGLFLFDLAGPGRAGPEGSRTTSRETDGWFMTATSTESAGGTRLDRSISLFQRGPDGRYDRVDEQHTLVLYDPHRVEDLCLGHGFAVRRRARYGSAATASTPPSGWTVFEAIRPR
jgi:hypothetical protein